MSKFIFISLCSLMSFVFSEEKMNFTHNQSICFEKVSENIFLSAKTKYKEKLIKDTLNFKKQNGQLNLPLMSGANIQKTFYDSREKEEENTKQYEYLGQFNDVGFYVTAVNYWEHFEVILTDKNSGNDYIFWSVPKLSPNNKKIASILSFGLEGNPVGIQIFSIDKKNYNQIEKLIEIDQSLWNPVDFVWEDGNSIILKTTEFRSLSKESKKKKDKKFSYLRLKINDF